MKDAAEGFSAKERGDIGERAVCRYLSRRGFRILSRNFRVRGGEIDIIASRFRYIVFVEVKTRSADTDKERFGRPADAVDAAKIAHLKRAAHRYLAETALPRKKPRFDLAEVYLTWPKGQTKPPKTKVFYRKEAF